MAKLLWLKKLEPFFVEIVAHTVSVRVRVFRLCEE